METEAVSSLTAYGPGYIDEGLKDLEQVVGLQTDKPLKRAFMPYGGIRWQSSPAVCMAMSQVKNYMKFLQNTIKHITMQCLISTHRR